MDKPHLPWVTHSMRGFGDYKYARAHANKNAPGLSYGIRHVESSWEWYYPQYEIEGDILDTYLIDHPARNCRTRSVIEKLREELNNALHEIKTST